MKLNPNRDVHSSFSEGVHLSKTNLHISEAIENFWHNVHRRREHRFVVKLTACNPDFRRTKPRYVELFRLDILMWTWNFHRLALLLRETRGLSIRAFENQFSNWKNLALISSIESWLILSEFRLESNTLRNLRFDEINLSTR